jgi:hypothetical protein
MTHKEKFHLNWDEATEKYVKKTEVIEEDLNEESIINEYIGAVKERKKLLEDLEKNNERLVILDNEFSAILDEFLAQYETLNREAVDKDELKALDDLHVKYSLLMQVRKYVKNKDK